MTMTVLELSGPIDAELPAEAAGHITAELVDQALADESDAFEAARQRQLKRRAARKRREARKHARTPAQAT
jgi:hypothetical protein